MYTAEIEIKQRDWAEQALFLMREMLPLMQPVLGHKGWAFEDADPLRMLASATARTSESLLLLVAYGQLWDAEVLGRSVLEGTLKFAFILQSQEDLIKRLREYSHDLFYIGLLKESGKAESLLAALSDRESMQWKPIRDLVLNPDEAAEYRARYPKQEMRRLETKWGFTGMISQLVSSGDPLFADFAGFAHQYSGASHVQHASYAGAAKP